jgi:uncharacterized protein (DUF4415 family)
MKKENIKSYTVEEIRQLRESGADKTDWQRLAAMSDGDIDTSEIPELDEAWFQNATLMMPENKERITMRFDRDLLTFFRKQGRGYQTRMNAVLRSYMQAQLNATKPPSPEF